MSKASEYPKITTLQDTDIFPVGRPGNPANTREFHIEWGDMKGLPFRSSSKTYSEAEGMIGVDLLIPGQTYYISDRGIYVRAITTSQFASTGIYEYIKGKKAWCAFSLAGTAGNVSGITIGTDNLLTATINYAAHYENARIDPGWTAPPKVDNSLHYLCKNIATNINANGAMNGKYKAYAICTYVVIEAVATGITLNDAVLAVTTTTLTKTVLQNMTYGVADLTAPLLFECIYDFNNDKLLGLRDPQNNNEIRFDQTITFDPDQLFEFNWNDSTVTNNRLVNCNIIKNFIIAGNSDNNGNAIVGNEFILSVFGGNLIVAGGISCNTGKYAILQSNVINYVHGGISGNTLIGMIDLDVSQNAKSEILENRITGMGIDQNRLYGGASIKYCILSILGAFGIRSNEMEEMTSVWNVSGLNSVRGNKLTPRGMLINLVGTSAGTILDGNEFTDDFNFSDINFGGSFNYFINNKYHGGDTIPRNGSPVIQSFQNTVIMDNIFMGSYFNSNTLTYVNIIGCQDINLYGHTMLGLSSGVVYYSQHNFRQGGRTSWDITFLVDSSNASSFNAANYLLFSTIKAGFVFDSGYVYGSGLTFTGGKNLSLGFPGTPTAIADFAISEISGLKKTLDLSSLPAVSADFTQHVIMNIQDAAISAGWVTIHLEGFKYNNL